MKDRLIGLDALKLLSAFTVVLIHTSTPSMAWREPMLRILPPANAVFAMMAGFFLWRVMESAQEKIRPWFGKRVTRLLVPYLIWETVYVVANILFDCVRGSGVLENIRAVSWPGVVFSGAGSVQLWFVISLFYAQCILMIIALLIDKRELLVLMVAVTAVGALDLKINMTGDMALTRVLYILGYVSLGVMMSAFVSGVRAIPILALVVASIFFGAAKSILWMLAFYALSSVINGGRLRVRKVIASLSSLMMGVYLVHMLICRVMSLALPRIVGSAADAPWMLLISVSASFVLSMSLVWLGRRFKWLWGE